MNHRTRPAFVNPIAIRPIACDASTSSVSGGIGFAGLQPSISITPSAFSIWIVNVTSDAGPDSVWSVAVM